MTQRQTAGITIIRSKRRTISLQIKDSEEIILRLPILFPDEKIQSVLNKHQAWIEKKQDEIRQRPKKATFQGRNNASVSYLGETLKLAIRAGDTDTVMKQNDRLLVTSSTLQENSIKENIVAWLKGQASDIIHDRCIQLSLRLNKRPKQIRIKTQKSRWGSCSSKGNINLNWKLIMYPLWVIDYVVIHELCHLSHPHHQASFWTEVETYCPDVNAAKQYLKSHQDILTGL